MKFNIMTVRDTLAILLLIAATINFLNPHILGHWPLLILAAANFFFWIRGRRLNRNNNPG